MKRIFITIASLLFLGYNGNSKPIQPKITLECVYSTEHTHFDQLMQDKDLCCTFELKTTCSDTVNESFIIVRHTETGVQLGIIYGVPTKAFILHVYKDYLTDYLDKGMVQKIAQIK